MERLKHRCFFREVRDVLGDLAGNAREFEKSLIENRATANILTYSCFQKALEKAEKVWNESSFGVCDICGASNCQSDHK